MLKHQPGRFLRAVAPLDGGAHAGVILVERCSLVSDYIKNVTVRRLDPRVGDPLAMVVEKTMHQGEPVGLRRRRDEVGDAIASVEHCLIGKLVAAAMLPGYRHDAALADRVATSGSDQAHSGRIFPVLSPAVAS